MGRGCISQHERAGRLKSSLGFAARSAINFGRLALKRLENVHLRVPRNAATQRKGAQFSSIAATSSALSDF
jgi:hypothetical protein